MSANIEFSCRIYLWNILHVTDYLCSCEQWALLHSSWFYTILVNDSIQSCKQWHRSRIALFPNSCIISSFGCYHYIVPPCVRAKLSGLSTSLRAVVKSSQQRMVTTCTCSHCTNSGWSCLYAHRLSMNLIVQQCSCHSYIKQLNLCHSLAQPSRFTESRDSSLFLGLGPNLDAWCRQHNASPCLRKKRCEITYWPYYQYKVLVHSQHGPILVCVVLAHR